MTKLIVYLLVSRSAGLYPMTFRTWMVLMQLLGDLIESLWRLLLVLFVAADEL